MNSRKLMFSIVKKTWNPVTGCKHMCRYCYAKMYSEKLAKWGIEPYKSKGFEPTFVPSRLQDKFRDGSLVFVCDMGDLFGRWVPDDWILRVIRHIRDFPRVRFLFLTKNPKRYSDFLDFFPDNAILGATIETNRDTLYRKYKISRAPPPSERYKVMRSLSWSHKLVSIEPILDFDLDYFVNIIRDINPEIVYVGYDNYNQRLPEPNVQKTVKLIERLKEFTHVYPKTLR